MSKSGNRLERIIGNNQKVGERRWTRLHQDADKEVLALSSGQYPVAHVIRDLVSEALHVRHLNEAGRHPAIRELLRTFDELINHRVQEATSHTTAHLTRQLEQTNRFLAALFLTLTEKLEFPAETSNPDTDDLLYTACADQANLMFNLILNRKPAAQTPDLAQELSGEAAP